MMEFFNELEPTLRTFYYVAIISSVIFVLQTLLTFLGSDSMDGADADFDSNLEDTATPFQLFSFRNLVNFCIGFGWTGVSFYNRIEQDWLLYLLATAIGALFVVVFFIIIKNLMKLSENNSFKIEATVGQIAEVYLKIPGEMSGRGKVQFSTKGSYRELDAITKGADLERGAQVRIVQVEKGNILIVESL